MASKFKQEIHENYEYCKACGGKCCKKSGCDFVPSDFESLKYQYLMEKLNEGYISIVGMPRFKKVKGQNVVDAFLYIRAREMGKGPVDIFSLRKACQSLTEEGCRYDYAHRPTGGKNLVPMPNPNDCYPAQDPEELVSRWSSHQPVLRRIVKELTGRSPEEELKDGFYKFFVDVLQQNFTGVHPAEVEDIRVAFPMLALGFPEEYRKALITTQNHGFSR